MSAKYAVSGRRFHQGRFISLSGYLKYRKTGGNYGFRKLCAERYSLRKYADRPVEAEKLEKVLEAGHNAPTAHNLQPQRILVMQSREALEKAEECTACKFHAPVILVVAYDPAKAWNREEI